MAAAEAREPVMAVCAQGCAAVPAQPTADLLARWTSTVTASDGSSICIRPLRPDDRQREIDFINSLSDESRYFRLFTPLKFLSPHLLDQLMNIDYEHSMALLATVHEHGAERIIGVARYGAADSPDTAELGITVTDSWQRRGVARLLIAELVRFARWRGLTRLTGIVLPDNHKMLALADSLGFTAAYDPAQHLVQIQRDL